MTGLLVLLLGGLTLAGLSLARRTARLGRGPGAFLDGGGDLPGWAVAGVGAGLLLAGWNLPEHLALVRLHGLQASHLALGLIPAAMAMVLLQRRLWIVARVTGAAAPGRLLGAYYGSTTLRLAVPALALLFGLPLAATLLAAMAAVLGEATGGALGGPGTIGATAAALFLVAAVGGWRGLVLALAIETALAAVLLVAAAGLAEALLPGPGFPSAAIPVAEGSLADRLPGVVQGTAGIGREAPSGGPFTAVAILSFAVALVGLAVSPAALRLAASARPGRAFAYGPVWLVAGLGTGLLLIAAPLLAARGEALADLAALDPLLGALPVLALAAACRMGATLFAATAALSVTEDVLAPDLLPGLPARGLRLAARIALALAFAGAAALAAFAPLAAALLATLALPLAAQLVPALLGLLFLPWLSRGAVLAGLALGCLAVLLTEPPGLILWDAPFPDLPWGRWPLTIHSAAWGLALNCAATFLAAIATRRAEGREGRDRLHAELASRHRARPGRVGQARWSLAFLWAFLALGPGAILGNSVLARPLGPEGEAGLPSLWLWQMLWWLIGVPLVWWLAYAGRLGLTSAEGLRTLAPVEGGRRPPAWIAQGLRRLGARAGAR